jgi:hypothetical protein
MAEEDEVARPKIGAGHLAAMGRAGIKELSQALVALPDSTIRPVEEPGLAGNLTPQEVVHGKSQYESMLQGYAGRGAEPQEQDRGMER